MRRLLDFCPLDHGIVWTDNEDARVVFQQLLAVLGRCLRPREGRVSLHGVQNQIDRLIDSKDSRKLRAVENRAAIPLCQLQRIIIKCKLTDLASSTPIYSTANGVLDPFSLTSMKLVFLSSSGLNATI